MQYCGHFVFLTQDGTTDKIYLPPGETDYFLTKSCLKYNS